jgi:uncharacterized membrane protein
MLFNFIKILHVISAAILFGLGLTTASYMWWVNIKGNIKEIAAATHLVVVADWIFTGVSGLLQPITGAAMIYLAGYSWSQFWIWAGLLGYIIAGICWLPVVYLQIKLGEIASIAAQNNTKLPLKYYRYYRYWFLLGWPAFISLIFVFYLMVMRPTVI